MKKIDLTKVPIQLLWKELERRESIAYARNVRREYRLREVREKEGK